MHLWCFVTPLNIQQYKILTLIQLHLIFTTAEISAAVMTLVLLKLIKSIMSMQNLYLNNHIHIYFLLMNIHEQIPFSSMHLRSLYSPCFWLLHNIVQQMIFISQKISSSKYSLAIMQILWDCISLFHRLRKLPLKGFIK